MNPSGRRLRLSLQTKVMVAVLGVLIALPVVTLWIVDDRLQRQMQQDAGLALSTARDSFLQVLKVRTNELMLRFRSGVYDQRFLAILAIEGGKSDAATMQTYLREDVLDQYNDDTEIALFVKADGSLFARTRRGGPATVTFEGFAAAAENAIHSALQGDPASENLAVNGSVYDVVALPVTPVGRGIVGALVFGIRITDGALQLARPPASEILVLAGNQVAASTLKDPVRNAGVLRQLAALAAGGDGGMVRIGGERFKPVTGALDEGSSRHGVQYVLLSSSEQRLSGLEQTRATLLGLSGLGVLVGAGVVGFFVRRITRPLVELRNSAEAVGRGDFSQRIERFSNDECGELAEAFNRMTSSLQSSRAELERAMQQVKMTQGQLIQSEKLSAVGQFVAGVAHELNNPLTAVVGFSELLQTAQTDAKTRGHLDRITKSAHRCHKIVQSLLSFARQHPPERKLVDLHRIIDEVLEIMAYDLRTSDITVTRDFAVDLPAIVGDAHQLQQVFVNIIGNARQAIEPVRREGKIAIRTRRSGDAVMIEFQDNGPGIRPENLARIFDPFFTTKPVGKGTGLGLSLCYGIVQEHGGKITARSDVGDGAIFTIEMPVTTQVSAIAPVVPAGGSASPFGHAKAPASGRSVLVIDDEEWILELASELLRAEGHTVETALGGQKALEILGHRRFDVIVSDWKMPGLNGVRLFEHLAATDPTATRRVLFMTGDVVSETFQDFLRTHELTCLSKPFATREFRAAVAKVFGTAGSG